LASSATVAVRCATCTVQCSPHQPTSHSQPLELVWCATHTVRCASFPGAQKQALWNISLVCHRTRPVHQSTAQYVFFSCIHLGLFFHLCLGLCLILLGLHRDFKCLLLRCCSLIAIVQSTSHPVSYITQTLGNINSPVMLVIKHQNPLVKWVRVYFFTISLSEPLM
jgi:hypothetical protein